MDCYCLAFVLALAAPGSGDPHYPARNGGGGGGGNWPRPSRRRVADEERTILGEQDVGAGHPVQNGVGKWLPPSSSASSDLHTSE